MLLMLFSLKKRKATFKKSIKINENKHWFFNYLVKKSLGAIRKTENSIILGCLISKNKIKVRSK